MIFRPVTLIYEFRVVFLLTTFTKKGGVYLKKKKVAIFNLSDTNQ